MYPFLLPFHIIMAGLWLGCVLTEALFERALLGQGRDKELILAALHRRVDLFVEIPAFSLVLLSGILLLAHAPASALLHIKLACAALALLANLYCVYLVFKRHRFASEGNWRAFAAADHLQHKAGALVLIGILGAMGLGISLFAAGGR